jgi:hypothetical protein
MEYTNKHDLFWELEAFDPKWQMHYATVAVAARAAKVLPLYADWLKSADGVRYKRTLEGVPDVRAQEAVEQFTRSRMQHIAPDLSMIGAYVDILESIEDKD